MSISLSISSQKTKCAECKCKMHVYSGALPVEKMYFFMNAGLVKSCFQCMHCKRIYCFDCSYDCSHFKKACLCGKTGGWIEFQYATKRLKWD